MSTSPRVSAPGNPSSFRLSQNATDRELCLHRLLRTGILLLDRVLRSALGIFEFSASPDCLLRISIDYAQSKMKVPQGLSLCRSEPLIDLHFWNEHFESLLAGKAPCARPRLICRHLHLSMNLLAAYLVAHPEINAQMIHARVVMPLGGRLAKFKTIAEMYGFNVTISPVRGIARVHDFFEDFLVRALLWAFNPGSSTRWRRLPLCRTDLWIDRSTLVARYLCEARNNTDPHDLFPQEVCLI